MILQLINANDNFEIWSKIGYNYGYNTSTKDSIHSINFTIGREQNFNNQIVGLSYNYANANIGEYSAHSLAIYYNLNIYNNKFVTAIASYGKLKANEAKNHADITTTINHNYNADIVLAAGIYGHNIRFSESILTNKISLEYNYISRSGYANGIGVATNRLSINIISPSVGVDYQMFLKKYKNLRAKFGANVKIDINLSKETKININLGNKNGTLKYDNSNDNVSFELSTGVNYNLKQNVKVSADSYMSFSSNGYFNLGLSVEGRFMIK